MPTRIDGGARLLNQLHQLFEAMRADIVPAIAHHHQSFLVATPGFEMVQRKGDSVVQRGLGLPAGPSKGRSGARLMSSVKGTVSGRPRRTLSLKLTTKI